MKNTLSRWRDLLTNKRAVWATDDVGRVFFVCDECKRIVPYWRLVGRGPASGCRCGAQRVRPGLPSQTAAIWWLFVVGLFWRRMVLRKSTQQEWDARGPWRIRETA